MTWKTQHRCSETLRAVAAAADERLDGVLPLDVPGVAETFADELELVAALQLRWHTRLSGRIEHQAMLQPMDLEQAVVDAWCATAAEMPGTRAVLDREREEPRDDATAQALAKATAKERVALAVSAGLASVSDPRAVRIGARLEERARAAYVAARPVAAGRLGRHARETFLGRLRAALAA